VLSARGNCVGRSIARRCGARRESKTPTICWGTLCARLQFVARTRESPTRVPNRSKMMAVYCISHSSDNTRCQALGWSRTWVSPPYSAGGQSLGQAQPLGAMPSVCRVSARTSHARTAHTHCETWPPNRAVASTKDHPLLRGGPWNRHQNCSHSIQCMPPGMPPSMTSTCPVIDFARQNVTTCSAIS
jgi:hypothetical protein